MDDITEGRFILFYEYHPTPTKTDSRFSYQLLACQEVIFFIQALPALGPRHIEWERHQVLHSSSCSSFHRAAVQDEGWSELSLDIACPHFSTRNDMCTSYPLELCKQAYAIESLSLNFMIIGLSGTMVSLAHFPTTFRLISSTGKPSAVAPLN